MRNRKPTLSAVLRVCVSFVLVVGAVAVSWSADDSISAKLKKDTDVGVAFNEIPQGFFDVNVTLNRPDDWYIVTNDQSSKVVSKSGETIWNRTSADEETHVWEGCGVTGDCWPGVLFAGNLTKHTAGSGEPPGFNASVADIDIDVDSLGSHSDEPTSHHWPPDGSYEEDERDTGDGTGGLYLPASLWTGVFPSSLPSATEYKTLKLTLNPRWVGAPSYDGNVGTLTFDRTGSGFALYEMTDSDSGTLVTSGIRVPPNGFSDKQFAILTNENFVSSGAINATFTWDSNLSTPNVAVTATDQVRLSPWFVELVLDSDNNNGLGDPDRGPTEKAAKKTAPGKILVVNHGDVDQDGVPDYASLDLSGAIDQPPLVPVILRTKFAGYASDATVKFDYGGEPLPTSNEFAGVDLGEGFRNYTAAKKGAMRLWKARNTRSASDFIVSGQEYTASELGFSDSSGDDIQEVPYYAEGINEGEPEITATVTFTLGGGSRITSTDKAKTTVAEPAVLFNCSNGSADGSTHDLPLGVPDVDYDIDAADEIIKHQCTAPAFWWRDEEEQGEDITENTLVDAEPLLITIPQVLIDQGFQFRLKAHGLDTDSEIRVYPAASPGGDGGNRLLYITTTQYAQQQVVASPVATLVGTTPSDPIQLAAGANEFVAMFKKESGIESQDLQIALQMVDRSGIPVPGQDMWECIDHVRRVIGDTRAFWTEFNCRNGAKRAVPNYPVDDRPVPPGGVRTDPGMQCYPAPTINPQGGLPFPLQAPAGPHEYYFIFVHGYNTTEANARKYNDILFKNMYLGLGFRGHYVGFLWEGNDWTLPGAKFALFRPNVQHALQSGLSLANALTLLNQRVTTPDNVDVMAHSLGNLVVSEGARLLQREPAKPWPNGRYAKSYVMVEGAVQREVFRPEGPYQNSDGVVYAANDLRTHSWAFLCNQTGHDASSVFTHVYNSYNPGDTVLTNAMRAADWNKSLVPARGGLHFGDVLNPNNPNRPNLDPLALMLFPPYPLRSFTGTTNWQNPPPPLPDSTWYALHQVPALMQNRALVYGPGNLTLPIGAVAPPQNEVSGNWTMNNAAAQM